MGPAEGRAPPPEPQGLSAPLDLVALHRGGQQRLGVAEGQV